MKRRRERRQPDRMPNDPSPDEIERQCQAFRRQWSEAVFRKRAGMESVPFTLPVAPTWFEWAYRQKLA